MKKKHPFTILYLLIELNAYRGKEYLYGNKSMLMKKIKIQNNKEGGNLVLAVAKKNKHPPINLVNY